MKLVKGPNIIKKIIVPITLNNTWTPAALLAETLAPILAITAVIVVPILSPNNTGSAASKPIAPCENNSCKIPIVALEL